jgi:DNA-binding LacI/PurR family transcriptional regulator/biotin operon repressor
MAKSHKPRRPDEPGIRGLGRLERPLSLTARVEQLLRKAIAEGQFEGGRVPTEVELAEQLGVSRETVRLAAEALQRDGLLVKIRRKGTFLQPVTLPDNIQAPRLPVLGYLQAGYPASPGGEEAVTRAVSGLMLQGALEEAAEAGYCLIAQHAPHTQIGRAFRELHQDRKLPGAIFAHYGEEKLLRRAVGLGMQIVLLDHDLPLPGVHSVRDDSFEGARLAVRHLAGLGHRRIAFANWRQTELNPWRLQGYRQGLRDAGLPRRRSWELSVELTEAGARRAAEQFLALAPRPTALYCFTNTLARLVIDELKSRALRVPDDMSVMGGGGEEVAGLACHQADWYEIGRIAVQILLRALEKPASQPEHTLCPHTIHAGATATRPAP